MLPKKDLEAQFSQEKKSPEAPHVLNGVAKGIKIGNHATSACLYAAILVLFGIVSFHVLPFSLSLGFWPRSDSPLGDGSQGRVRQSSLKDLPPSHAQLFFGLQKPSSAHTEEEEKAAAANGWFDWWKAPPPVVDNRSPVILIPPLAGTRLMAELDNKTSVVHLFCQRTSGKYLIWVDPAQMVPGVIDCWEDNMRLEYDPETKTTHSPQGVKVYPQNNTDAVMVLSKLFPDTSMIYGRLADLLKQRGWTADEDLVGFPMDWRVGPEAHSLPGNHFDRLRWLIEDRVAQSGRKAVVVHMSLGAAFFNLFLQTMTEEWKSKHIDTGISLAGVYGGTPVALLFLLSAHNWLPVIKIDPVKFHEMVRSFPSVVWLSPRVELYDDQPFIKVGDRNYTAKDIPDVLRLADANTSAEFWHLHENSSPINPPGIPIHCIFSGGIDTATFIEFPEGGFDRPDSAKVTYGDGDGAVITPSLEVCAQWERKQTQEVFVKRIRNVAHADIVKDQDALAYAVEVIVNASMTG